MRRLSLSDIIVGKEVFYVSKYPKKHNVKVVISDVKLYDTGLFIVSTKKVMYHYRDLCITNN